MIDNILRQIMGTKRKIKKVYKRSKCYFSGHGFVGFR